MSIHEKMDAVASEVLERLRPFGVTTVVARRLWDGHASITAAHPGIGPSTWYVLESVHESLFAPAGPPSEELARRFANAFARQLVDDHQRFVTARRYPDSIADWCIGDYVRSYRVVSVDRVTNTATLDKVGESLSDVPARKLNEWLLEDGAA